MSSINRIFPSRESLLFWKELMQRVSEIDFGEPLPQLDDKFVRVWSSHYAKIAGMTQVKPPILEIGTGYGVLAAGLGLISGGRVCSTEHPSRSYLTSASYLSFLNEFKIDMIAHDLTEGLPFKQESFQQVYLCDVIEHFPPESIPFILHEISGVLRPGGSIILSTPNLNRLSGLFRLLAGYSINPPLEVRRIGKTFDHIRELAPKEILNLLTKLGFQPKKCKFATNPYFTAEAFGEDNIFSPGMSRAINMLTGILIRVAPRFGDEMYIVADK
jgi:2-polyprenyl-3-methyl-5-hydroxy-6-metoxy-1,4-benzoquinol methylase